MDVIKLSKSKIYEEIAEQIKGNILSGKLVPGEKLPSSKELAERFQVGMSTVREALSALKAMGLIETRQGEGSFVKQIKSADLIMPTFSSLLMNKQTLTDLLEARKALEVSNAAIAAEKRTQEDLQNLNDILSVMSSSLGDETIGEQSDVKFHLTLAGATHNAIMVRLLETISEQMEAAIRETRRLYMYGNQSVSKQLWVEHKEIYEAIRLGDAMMAQEKMKQHLFHVERVLSPFIK
jgi:GntR family transcriptional repressor for pyruvate dehydrogenase complex